MTSKQCNSCKYHIHVKEFSEGCFRHSPNFMKKKDCNLYRYGELNQDHKEFFEEIGEEYPFTEMK